VRRAVLCAATQHTPSSEAVRQQLVHRARAPLLGCGGASAAYQRGEGSGDDARVCEHRVPNAANPFEQESPFMLVATVVAALAGCAAAALPSVCTPATLSVPPMPPGLRLMQVQTVINEGDRIQSVPVCVCARGCCAAARVTLPAAARLACMIVGAVVDALVRALAVCARAAGGVCAVVCRSHSLPLRVQGPCWGPDVNVSNYDCSSLISLETPWTDAGNPFEEVGRLYRVRAQLDSGGASPAAPLPCPRRGVAPSGRRAPASLRYRLFHVCIACVRRLLRACVLMPRRRRLFGPLSRFDAATPSPLPCACACASVSASVSLCTCACAMRAWAMCVDVACRRRSAEGLVLLGTAHGVGLHSAHEQRRGTPSGVRQPPAAANGCVCSPTLLLGVMSAVG
jgi:hypothetical protein